MGLINEFKEFAVKGNAMDMAVGIIIGGAFGKIVSSLVTDVVMPPIGVLMGGVDFSSLQLTIKDAVPAAESQPAVAAVTVNYGVFINTVIDFLIVAMAIFVMVKLMNAARRKEEAAPAAPPAPPRNEVLLEEIRDALKSKA